MMIIAAVQMANRKGNPVQLFWVLLMMAWITLGPIIEDYNWKIYVSGCLVGLQYACGLYAPLDW